MTQRQDQVLLLRIGEVAKALACGRTTVYQLMTAGDLPRVKIGRNVRVPREAVEEYVRQMTEQHGRTTPGGWA